MTASDLSPTSAEESAPHASVELEATALTANMSAIGTAHTTDLSATGTAIGIASVDGDASVTMSAVPLLSAKGNATFRQSYASAFLAGDTIDVSQGGAPVMIAKHITIDHGAGCALVAGEAEVKSGWVGMVISGKTQIAEDAHVVITTKAALIIALALFGGFGLVAAALFFGAQRVAAWRPQVSLPPLPEWVRHRERHA